MTTLTKVPRSRAVGQLAEAVEVAASASTSVTFRVGATILQIPSTVALQIAALLDDVGEGRHVTVAPYDLPIGTERGAELLGVSRPWLAALLDRGEIPMVRNGTKRRVRLGDLMSYRRADDRNRRSNQTWDFLDEE